jgi:RNA-directed DNA polymerase
MTRQKSDRRVVPQARRKPGRTRADETAGGGKAASVDHREQQLELRFETAEWHESERKDEPMPATATMEKVCELLETAFEKVEANRGAAGPDRQSIRTVREHLPEVLLRLRPALLDGTYRPGMIRRVWIPKAGGGERGLGIPNVIDRMVQEAVRAVLEPLYEPTFHSSSHGFRPGRSCHTAIAAAREHMSAGYEWVVDIDLEKFFDRVNHQRLMARLAQRIDDRRLLALIGKMLKAQVVMPDGVVVRNDDGVPQGGPLSPLLSNIVLDELDRELDERGHRFVRYADDCNIYVRSETAGRRVMLSLKRFIRRRLRLAVNAKKSAVARPERRHFLGFRLRKDPLTEVVEVRLSKRSEERLVAKVVELTPRNWGDSIPACIKRINAYVRGWLNFFGICSHGSEFLLHDSDAHIRRRLRAIQLSHWKRKRSIARKLIQLGVRHPTAWRTVYDGRKSTWTLSHSPAVEQALSPAYFARLGLLSLEDGWCEHPKVVPRKG